MILCLSDLHNIRLINRLKNLIFEDFDVVFFLGDLSDNEDIAKEFLNFFEQKKLLFYCVPGNNDPVHIRDLLECNIEKQDKIYNEWRIVGIGGSPITPFNTVYEKTEGEIKKQLEKLNIDENTILLSHFPPYGIFDKTKSGDHAGSHSLLKIIEKKKPFAVFCGHIHEQQGYEKVENTHVFKIPALKHGKVMTVVFKPKPGYEVIEI